MSEQPLSPIDIETKLRGLVNEMTSAQQSLAHARDLETTTEIALKRARARAFHDDACPRVARGLATVADKEAFVDEHVMDQWEAWARAATATKIAQDHMRTLSAITDAVRSLGSSVRTAYSLSGAA